MGEKRLQRVQGGLAYVTLAVVLLSVLLLGGYSPIAWSLLSIAVVVIFAGQVCLAAVTRVPLAVERLVLPGLLFLAVMGWGWVQTWGGVPDPYAHPLWALVPEAPAAISADPGQGRHAVMRLLVYAMIFLVILWASVDGRRAARLLKAIAIFSTLLAAYGLFAFDTGENVLLGDASARGLVTATFVNRNHYATYAVFGALANLAAYLHVSRWQADSTRGRLEGFFSGAWIYALGLVLCIGAVSLTQSRAGGVAGLVGLATFLLAWRRGRGGWWETVMALLLLAVLVFVAFTSATGLTARLLATGGEDARFTVYPAIVAAIAERPLLGHGLGAFEDAFRPYVPAEVSALEWTFAHNTYLELAFGLGLVGAGAFLASLGLIVLRIHRGARTRRNDRVYACLGLGCAAAAGFHAVFDFSLQMPSVAALFAVILGLAYAQSFSSAEIGAVREGRRRKGAREAGPAPAGLASR